MTTSTTDLCRFCDAEPKEGGCCKFVQGGKYDTADQQEGTTGTESNWVDRYEDGLPPENQWVEVEGYVGLKHFGTPFKGKAYWYRKPNHESFHWKANDGHEYGSWYLEVERWRPISQAGQTHFKWHVSGIALDSEGNTHRVEEYHISAKTEQEASMIALGTYVGWEDGVCIATLHMPLTMDPMPWTEADQTRWEERQLLRQAAAESESTAPATDFDYEAFLKSPCPLCGQIHEDEQLYHDEDFTSDPVDCPQCGKPTDHPAAYEYYKNDSTKGAHNE